MIKLPCHDHDSDTRLDLFCSRCIPPHTLAEKATLEAKVTTAARRAHAASLAATGDRGCAHAAAIAAIRETTTEEGVWDAELLTWTAG